MFSVSTYVAIFFFGFVMFFAITIWIDSKKKYVLPPKFNYKNGDTQTSGENAQAQHQEIEKTGEFFAKATLDGQGSAMATAELGFEYEDYDGEREITFVTDLKFSYRVNLESSNDNSTSKAKIETFFNAKTAVIVDKTLSNSGSQSLPEEEGTKEIKKRMKVVLKPGEKLDGYIKLSAETEASGSGNSQVTVSANLLEITYWTDFNVK